MTEAGYARFIALTYLFLAVSKMLAGGDDWKNLL